MELINNTNKETTTTAQNTRTYGKKKPVKPSLKFLIIKKRPKCVCLRKYRDLIECVPNVDKRNKHNFLARQHNRDVFFCSANFSVSFNQHKSEWEKLHLLVKENFCLCGCCCYRFVIRRTADSAISLSQFDFFRQEISVIESQILPGGVQTFKLTGNKLTLL
jgi:hypothetical protein